MSTANLSGVRLFAFQDSIAADGLPRLDHEAVAAFVQARDDCFLDVDQEPMGGAAGVYLGRDAGNL